MRFSFSGNHGNDLYGWFAEGLRTVMEGQGHMFVEDPDEASLVVNFFPKGQPRPFRRRAQAVFVVSVSEVDPPFQSPVQQGYPLVVRSLANLVVALVPTERGGRDAHFLTPEQGHYVVGGDNGKEDYFRQVYSRIHPLATSRLVIDNVYDPDLPEELRRGNEVTESITRAGRKLDALNLLPAAFPIEEVLSQRELRHLKRLYGIGGLSYGNVSAREDDTRFWMSASGVDKSNLVEVGRDIILVKDYDPERIAMILSVPPDIETRRVSVDAIEHWMIYREHPRVGAILHVHAWMEGIPSTEFNYPCGTYELGKAVADLVREAEDPARTVIGLRNHGLTITGHSLDEIFERVDGRLVRNVPMS